MPPGLPRCQLCCVHALLPEGRRSRPCSSSAGGEGASAFPSWRGRVRDGVVAWGDRAGLVAIGVSIAACGGHVTAVLRRPKGPPRVYDRSLAVNGPPGARTRSVLAKDDSAEALSFVSLFALHSMKNRCSWDTTVRTGRLSG